MPSFNHFIACIWCHLISWNPFLQFPCLISLRNTFLNVSALLTTLIYDCWYLVITDSCVFCLGAASETGTGAERGHQEQGETPEEPSGTDWVHTHAAHHTQLCAPQCRGRSCDSLSNVWNICLSKRNKERLIGGKIYPAFVLNYITNIVKQTALYKSNIFKTFGQCTVCSLAFVSLCLLMFDLSGVIESNSSPEKRTVGISRWFGVTWFSLTARTMRAASSGFTYRLNSWLLLLDHQGVVWI